MPIRRLTNEIMSAAILGFEEQKRRIDVQIAEIRSQLGGSPGQTAAPESTRRPRPRMSAAGRRRIAAAQRKRWAEAKAASQPQTPSKPKRKLSAAGRAAIIAATKKRWAAKRAEAKK
jgi:hypothetical protein